MGVLRAVKSEDIEGQSREDNSFEVQKIKWGDLTESIWQICREFSAVFQKDLPKGVPPRQMGHEFKFI